MKKMFVLVLIVGVLTALAGIAFAEHDNIGGIGTKSMGAPVRTMERGDIGGVGSK